VYSSTLQLMAEEGEQPEKKGLFHKFKALKRRTAQVIASKLSNAEVTVDEAYVNGLLLLIFAICGVH
jgi:hypothetical protein